MSACRPQWRMLFLTNWRFCKQTLAKLTVSCMLNATLINLAIIWSVPYSYCTIQPISKEAQWQKQSGSRLKFTTEATSPRSQKQLDSTEECSNKNYSWDCLKKQLHFGIFYHKCLKFCIHIIIIIIIIIISHKQPINHSGRGKWCNSYSKSHSYIPGKSYMSGYGIPLWTVITYCNVERRICVQYCLEADVSQYK